MAQKQRSIDVRIVHVLAQDATCFGQVSAALWALCGRTIVLADLDWARRLWGETGPQLFWTALHASGVLNGQPPKLVPVALAALIGDWANLCTQRARGAPVLMRDTIVATLPHGFPIAAQSGRSLRQAAIAIIDQAMTTLVLCTPYLDRAGISLLLDALRAAALRNVAITIITQELHNPQSPNAQAIALLRHELAGARTPLCCYSALPADMGEPTVTRIHAKVLLADAHIALIGSANITGAGLGHNMELGVVVRGAEVIGLVSLLDALLQTSLVEGSA
jgi:phosphatidylserine/phosphatidylglycerophosphate/cardiolipin synthase-like enzyme